MSNAHKSIALKEWLWKQPGTQINSGQREAIRILLIQFDPILAIGNPEGQHDEYDLEIPMVFRAALEHRDYKSLRSALRRVFAETTGTLEAGTVFRHTKLAKELIKLKLNETAGPGDGLVTNQEGLL